MNWFHTPLAAAVLLLGCAANRPAAPRLAFPAPATLLVQEGLPDPLVAFDGARVTSARQWVRERRPELKALFEHYMYGAIPPQPREIRFEPVAEYHDFLDGQATLKLVRIVTGPGAGPRIDLMIVSPRTGGPAPAFLAMNFCGNQAVTSDPRVPLTQGWLYKNCQGCTNHLATEAARGAQAASWPLAEIVRRGYALATFCSADIDADRPDVSNGIYQWLAGGNAAANNPTNRGTLAAWAWGYHRCMDYLVREPAIDPRRIAAFGHSRNGKTALLAAAFDERIAMAFPHQAGCGGTAPSRGVTGETVKAINDHFPHWFNGAFKQFNEDPRRLPFDQNALLALCAPRPVMFSAAEKDQWANPAGQFQVLLGARSVYQLLGVDAMESVSYPPIGQVVTSPLGFFRREGVHSVTPEDWQAFLAFADRHFRPK